MDCPDERAMAGPAAVFRTLELGLLTLQRLDESWRFPEDFRGCLR